MSETTTVKKVDLTIEQLFDSVGVGSDSVLTAEKKKNNILSNAPPNTEFLDNIDKEKEEEEVIVDENKAVIPPVNSETIDKLTEEIENQENGSEAPKKLNKGSLFKMVTKMIEDKELVPFEGEKLEDYTVEDYKELLKANLKRQGDEAAEKVPGEFYNSLPKELQYAYQYIADGGRDLKGLFRSLGQVEEIRALSLEDESGQEQICRAHLYATSFGEPEDIEEEINAWKDRGELEAKATKFKPKLDKMNEQIVAQKLGEAEEVQKQVKEASKYYMHNVHEVLQKGELNGIKLDKKTQDMLWHGLTDNTKHRSQNGAATNELGYLLQQHQWGEKPRYDLIAEALWLLKDPDGFKNKIRKEGGKETTEKVVRMLKTEQSNKSNGTNQDDDNTEFNRGAKPKTLVRPGTNFFKR